MTSRPEPCPARAGGGQAGFSLLEVLIAVVIAGIAMATMFRAASESIQATSVAARYEEAVSRARSHLDSVSANLVPGEQSGDDGGGFRWSALVRAVHSTGKLDGTGLPAKSADTLIVTLYAASVWVRWHDGARERMVRLDTQRLLTSAPG